MRRMTKDTEQKSSENREVFQKDAWKGKAYSFFNHKDCEFFPCHKTDDEENFNCLFCYCPLYALGDKCGGNFQYTEGGIKDCSNCMVPHKRNNYGYIMSKFGELVELTKKKEPETEKSESEEEKQ